MRISPSSAGDIVVLLRARAGLQTIGCAL